MLLSFFLNSLFPRRCIGCAAVGEWLCLSCGALVAAQPGSLEGGIMWLAPFEGAVRQGILACKYGGIPGALDPVLEKLLDSIHAPPQFLGCTSVLLPVPLSKARLKERGYNQAEYIAQWFAKKYGLPVVSDLLVKQSGKSLVGKTIEERAEAVQKLFSVTAKARQKELPKEVHYIIIDDVVTTGSTLRYCMELVAQATGRPCSGLAVAHEI